MRTHWGPEHVTQIHCGDIFTWGWLFKQVTWDLQLSGEQKKQARFKFVFNTKIFTNVTNIFTLSYLCAISKGLLKE